MRSNNLIERIDPREIERLNAHLIDSRVGQKEGEERWLGLQRKLGAKRRNTIVAGQMEVLKGSVWASFAIANNQPVTPQTLFQTTIGQPGQTANITSMTAAGQLPAPQMLDCRAIRLVIRNDVALVDYLNFMWNSTFTLFVSNKPRLKVPCYILTAGCGPVVFGGQIGTLTAVDGQVYAVNNGVADERNLYALSQPIVIGTSEVFSVLINPDVAWNTSNAGKPVGTGITVAVHLEGELYTAVA
jgi:hypothetical protein